jgi:hypothetical protein
VAAGITSGARFYLLTLVGCLCVGIVCVVAVLLFDRMAKQFLLVIRAGDVSVQEKAEAVLKKSGLKYSLSSVVSNAAYSEVIFEVGLAGKEQRFLSALRELPGVTTVSLVDCHKN